MWVMSWSSSHVARSPAGLVHSSNEYGLYSIPIAGAGLMVGGDQSGNGRSGSSGNDVLNGFDGDDELVDGAGADRLYGGAGHGAVSYEADAAAVTIQLGPLQQDAALWAPLIEDGQDV